MASNALKTHEKAPKAHDFPHDFLPNHSSDSQAGTSYVPAYLRFCISGGELAGKEKPPDRLQSIRGKRANQHSSQGLIVMTTMFNNIDTTADVNPANRLPFVGITGRFSQPALHVFSGILAPQTPITYEFSHQCDTTFVTLRSKYNVTCHTGEKMRKSTAVRQPQPTYVDDCESMSATDLRKAYPQEANTHRNMLFRQKRNGALVDPAFQEFKSFLRTVGPAAAQGATLDRIDNTNPAYGPGLVRWADKQTQNNNKSDTRTIHDAQTNTVYTVSRLSDLTGVPANTIRQRLHRGWSDAEIIRGSRDSSPVLAPVAQIEVQPRNVIAFPRPENALEREFRAKARAYREHGAGAFPASFEVVFDLFEDEANVPDTASPEYARAMEGFEEQYKGYVKAFPAKWAKERPHIENFNLYYKLPPHVMQLIENIDPEFVRKQAERNAQTDLIARQI